MTTQSQQAPNAPREHYPAPIGVLTSTLLGFNPNNYWELIIVELQNPELKMRSLVLPGGIFEVGGGKHRSQRDVINHEGWEESGLSPAPEFEPIHLATSQRLDADPRYWCSFPTVNGANDYIMAAPLVGVIDPKDKAEVRRAYWQDVRDIDLNHVGRGHDLLIKLWQVICECGGLTPELFTPDNIARIEALSNDRHVVSLGRFNHMIYLEDQNPVFDQRH